MWTDTHARFSPDEKQVYTTGFSGGARVAVSMVRGLPGEVAGVIACGAGFPTPPARRRRRFGIKKGTLVAKSRMTAT